MLEATIWFGDILVDSLGIPGNNIAPRLGDFIQARSLVLYSIDFRKRIEPCYFFALSLAALINPTNNGCGRMGLDKNSGWNWLPTM